MIKPSRIFVADTKSQVHLRIYPKLRIGEEPTKYGHKMMRTRPDSNRRPNAPQAFALSKLCNESNKECCIRLNLDCAYLPCHLICMIYSCIIPAQNTSRDMSSLILQRHTGSQLFHEMSMW